MTEKKSCWVKDRKYYEVKESMELAYSMHHLLSLSGKQYYILLSQEIYSSHNLNQYHFLAETVFEMLILYENYIWKTVTLLCF